MATTDNDKYAIASNVGVIAKLTEILADINLRLKQAESRYSQSDLAAQEVASQGVRYLETVVVPVATKVADLLRAITDIFVTKSKTTVTPAVATLTFVVEDSTFGSLGNVSITKSGDINTGLYGPVLSFDPDSRVLVVDVMFIYGSTAPNSAWDVTAALPFDAHVGRMDNPHGTTAAQVGAYTKAEINSLMNDLSNMLRGTATATGDTLGELEQRLIALIGTADASADTLGELQALIVNGNKRLLKKSIAFSAAMS